MHLDLNHHVHSGATFDRLDSFDSTQTFKSCISACLQLLLQIFEEVRAHLGEDLWQSGLYETIRVKENHAVLAEVVDYFVKVAVIIVNDSPSATPSGETEYLAQSTSADNGSVVGDVAERNKGTVFIIGKAVVHLIRDDGNLELIGHGNDLHHVFTGPAGAAGVAGIVDQDSLCVWFQN